MAALKCEICGGGLIGKPGGVFECEYCGVQYDTSWAKAKIQEIRGTVQVEGTVEVKGTVAVDNKANKENLLKRIAICAEDREFSKVDKLIDDLLKTDSDCWEAYLWQYASNAKLCSIDAVFNQHLHELKKFKDSKYWKNALRCMPSDVRAEKEGQLNAKIEYWTAENKELKKQFDRIQPVQNLLYTVNKSILGLHSDGTVSVSYAEEDKWLAPVSKWKGVRKICVCDFLRCFVLGLCWDGRVLVAANKQDYAIGEIQSWMAYNDNEADEFSKIIDITNDDSRIACLWDDGEVTSTQNDSACFGYACEWEDVKEIHWVTVDVGEYAAEMFGLNKSYPYVHMLLGLTYDNRILCSASCNEKSENQYISGKLHIEEVEKLRNVRAISKDGKYEIVLQDGTKISFRNNDTSGKWLDINLTDKGIVTAKNSPSKYFTERDLLAGEKEYAAIRADGTVARAVDSNTGKFMVSEEVNDWSNIVALKNGYHVGLLGLRENGTVLLSKNEKGAECISVEGWKLFGSLDTFEQERKAAENKYKDVAKNKWLANQKKREEEEKAKELELKRIADQKAAYRQQGLCQHCGGTFKGLFSKKCTNCGKEKDYIQ